ncbi:DUF3883 domain-containing protein [Nostocaceae cyanobacterium CENA357]|uniref:DUF3883 domain-containing protein n=1 Tax=Atlanticothrix silvestris CENA357 TaxID=1725252 RepID=A0A8J7L3T8_9CYAN|nr:DUF3883 domain-containing protein [Atlanticothrix silvestris]MBH8551287.1 DUF3883 domain-containing protein [Atlanticothrix silvestris CENA357]
MQRKLAVKRLTASDLTFFEWHFKNRPAGKQKAINLNADIFIKRLYPTLLDYVQTQTGSKIPLDLSIYGPGLEGEYNLQRKIVRGNTYKNWRLNGEFVTNPDESPERFNILEPGDFIIFDFNGISVPVSAKAIFVAGKHLTDASLHVAIDSFLGNSKMESLTPIDIRKIINENFVISEHPINELVLDDALEDFVQGGNQGLQKLLLRPPNRKLSPIDLKKAKETAQANGRRCEEFVNEYLATQKTLGNILDYIWQSNENPVSVYDFSLDLPDGSRVLIDVKSTGRDFTQLFHVSLGELRCMANAERYDIYRVFSMDHDAAKLRIAKNVKDFALEILEVFKKLPKGIYSDSVSVEPSFLFFDGEINIQIDEMDED